MSPHPFGVTNDVAELSHGAFPILAVSQELDAGECRVTHGVPPACPVWVW